MLASATRARVPTAYAGPGVHIGRPVFTRGWACPGCYPCSPPYRHTGNVRVPSVWALAASPFPTQGVSTRLGRFIRVGLLHAHGLAHPQAPTCVKMQTRVPLRAAEVITRADGHTHLCARHCELKLSPCSDAMNCIHVAVLLAPFPWMWKLRLRLPNLPRFPQLGRGRAGV